MSRVRLRVDPVAVEEALTGRPVHVNRWERAEAVRVLSGRALSLTEQAALLHVTPRSIGRIRARLREEAMTPRKEHHIPSHTGPEWDPEPWQTRAACRDHDPELFHDQHREDVAISICRGFAGSAPCPVREECLAQALRLGDSGVYGGTTERQRKRMRRKAAA